MVVSLVLLALVSCLFRLSLANVVKALVGVTDKGAAQKLEPGFSLLVLSNKDYYKCCIMSMVLII